MNALDVIDKILDSKLYSSDLKYCFVDDQKRPYKFDNTLARPNKKEDFVDFDTLLQHYSFEYAGVGISVQASNVFAIDVDHCFSKAFDKTSADDRAKDILEMFKSIAYCEFSFSGTGLRVLFRMKEITDYLKRYYIKNSNEGIEFYQPTSSFRYVTVTGMHIYNNDICSIDDKYDVVISFLDRYMQKTKKQSEHITVTETRSIEQLKNLTKYLYLKNPVFQNLWFSNAPGSGKNESELDFQLIALLFENVTTDKEKLREIFESSPYFKSKDNKHLSKWTYGNHRYYEYIYSHL